MSRGGSILEPGGRTSGRKISGLRFSSNRRVFDHIVNLNLFDEDLHVFLKNYKIHIRIFFLVVSVVITKNPDYVLYLPIGRFYNNRKEDHNAKTAARQSREK